MRRLVPVVLIFAVVLGCGRKSETTASKGKTTATRLSATDLKQQQQSPQRIIRTANISMVVGDTASVLQRATAVVEASGGYVSDSRVWRDGELLRGTLSLRVPEARLSDTLAAIRKLAVRVQSESVGSEEVTQEYIDLESQLRNLEATEVELRELMRVIRERSRKASEVLEMHQQLMSIRAQIEQTKGRMRYLSQMSAFATLNVELIPDAIAKPVVEPGWQPVVVAKEAAGSLVKALQIVTDLAIWLVIYFAPILLMILIAVLTIRRVITLAWRTRRSPSL
jgi:hypothetical protein